MLAQLLVHEGMEREHVRPATKQVDAAASQLTGARASQHEVSRTTLDEAMDLVEKLGKPLNLVNDNQRHAAGSTCNTPSQLLFDLLGVATQCGKCHIVQEVIRERVWDCVVNQPAFAGLTRSQQEAALAAGGRTQVEQSVYIS
jgi:bacterioferritin-associated ferredoxin